MNRYKKGQRNQQKCKRYYESMGYEVEVVRYNMYMARKDFFSLWDLICVGPHDIVFVQVKTNQKPTKEWQERANAWGPTGSKVKRVWCVYRDYQRGDVPSLKVTLSPKS